MKINLSKAILLSAFVVVGQPWCIAQSDTQTPATIEIQSQPGPYAVGQILLDWTDTKRGEPATETNDDKRQIPVQIWYPAQNGATGEQAPYRPRVEAFRESWGEESIEFYNSVQTSWIKDAPVSDDGPFPLFVFSHGWGARSSSHGTFLSNLASHGYIVVGINHPYLGRVVLASGDITEPDDEQFTDQESANKFYAQDVTFVLDMMTRLNGGDGHFAGAVDTKRTAAGGHSSGFPAVSGAAVVDRRIAALISFDSGVPAIVRREGLGVPVFLFRGEKDSYTDLFFRGKNVHPKGTIYTVDFFRVHRADFYDLVISGTTHSSVYDEYLFAETALERESYIRNHTIIATYAVAYLDQVLKDIESPLLKKPSVDDPSTTLRVIPSLKP